MQPILSHSNLPQRPLAADPSETGSSLWASHGVKVGEIALPNS